MGLYKSTSVTDNIITCAHWNEQVDFLGGETAAGQITLDEVPDGSTRVLATAASTADAVWDELQSAHVGAGSFGKQISDIEGYVDGLNFTSTNIHSHVKVLDDIDFSATMKTSLNTVGDDVLDTAVPGSPTAHSVNQRIKAIDELTEASGDGDLKAMKDILDVLPDSGALTTIDGLFDVPSKDATADATMRDVVGKKDDTAVTTVATTKSLMAYLKGVIGLVDGIESVTDNLPDSGALTTIDGLFDVPSKDATADATVRDVVGKKDDTAVTTVATTKSLMAYLKGVLNEVEHGTYGLSAIETLVDGIESVTDNLPDSGALTTIDGLFDVPSKDATADATVRDVVGKKDDTAVTTVATTKSLMAYLKGVIGLVDGIESVTDNLPDSGALTTIDGLFDVPSKDATADTTMRDVIGKKDDTTVTSVGTTKSVIAYVKGIIDLVDGIEAVTDNLPDSGALSTIDGLFDVPSKDAAGDVTMRDVIGKKDDTAAGAVDTDKSIVSYAKGILTDTIAIAELTTQGDTNETKLDTVTTNVGTVDTVVDAILIDTGTDIVADFDRHVVSFDCWSDTSAVVTITGGATDVNLPDVIIPTLPTGATVWKIVYLFKCAKIKDTSTADNAINGACNIRIKDSGGAWDTDDITAYNVQDNSWSVDVSEATEIGGDAFSGNMNNDNLTSEVTGAGTYNSRFDAIQADGANLLLHDVNVGLRVYIY